jgi:hypothetical protein
VKYEVTWTEDGKKYSKEKHSYRAAEVFASSKPNAEIKSVGAASTKLKSLQL